MANPDIYNYGDFVTHGGKCWKWICPEGQYDPCLPTVAVQPTGFPHSPPGTIGTYNSVTCETPWLCYKFVSCDNDTIVIDVAYHSEQPIFGFQFNLSLPFPMECSDGTNPVITLSGGAAGAGWEVDEAITIDSQNNMVHFRFLGHDEQGASLAANSSTSSGCAAVPGDGTEIDNLLTLTIQYPFSSNTYSDICKCLGDPTAGNLFNALPGAAVTYERIVGGATDFSNWNNVQRPEALASGGDVVSPVGTVDSADRDHLVDQLVDNINSGPTYHGWGSAELAQDFGFRAPTAGVEALVALTNEILNSPTQPVYPLFLHETAQCCWEECIPSDPCTEPAPCCCPAYDADWSSEQNQWRNQWYGPVNLFPKSQYSIPGCMDPTSPQWVPWASDPNNNNCAGDGEQPRWTWNTGDCVWLVRNNDDTHLKKLIACLLEIMMRSSLMERFSATQINTGCLSVIERNKMG